MAILSKDHKPDKVESHNPLKLNWGLCSNFECESFLESNSPDILALCETNLDDSIDSGDFSVIDYLSLIWKDCYLYAWPCSLSEGRTLFAQDLSLENSMGSYLCFGLVLLHSVSHFFFLYWSTTWSLFAFFEIVSSNIDKVLSINPSVNLLVFRGFNAHQKAG